MWFGMSCDIRDRFKHFLRAFFFLFFLFFLFLYLFFFLSTFAFFGDDMSVILVQNKRCVPNVCLGF